MPGVRKTCELCAKNPCFAMPGQKARLCGDHREVGMVNVKHKTCELCAKRPTFATPGQKARFCGYHREVGMVDVVSGLGPCRTTAQPLYFPLS